MIKQSIRNPSFFRILAVSAVLAVFAASALAQKADKTAADKPALMESATTTLTATVEAIDLEKREVTLKDQQGHSVTIDVSEDVKNLAQVEVGDQVRIEYLEAIAVQVLPADSVKEQATAGQVVAEAKPDQKPAGALVNEVTVTTTIEAIDKTAQTVTLKGPAGNTRVIKVRNPANLEKVELGDQVIITYTEALAVSVEEIEQ